MSPDQDCRTNIDSTLCPAMFRCSFVGHVCDSEVSATPRHRAAVPLDGDTEQVCSSTHLISHLSPARHELCIADYPQWANALSCHTRTLSWVLVLLYPKSLPLYFLLPLYNSAIAAFFYPPKPTSLTVTLSLSLSISVSVSVLAGIALIWIQPCAVRSAAMCPAVKSPLWFDFSQKFPLFFSPPSPGK